MAVADDLISLVPLEDALDLAEDYFNRVAIGEVSQVVDELDVVSVAEVLNSVSVVNPQVIHK